MELRFYFKHIFDTYIEEIATQRLERLLDKFSDIPKVLQKFVENRIVSDFPNVPKTSSCNENYYRQTLPDELKMKYKTPNRITNYLQKQMQNWTGEHIKNTNM